MGYTTGISWCDHSFNMVWGCQRVSAGCQWCYAETFAKRLGFNIWGPPQTTERRLFGDKHWAEPLKWDAKATKEGRRHRVFCASMADVFEDHPQLPEQRLRLWELIRATPNLDWQLLTKRPENILAMVPPEWAGHSFPPNVWVGTTVEDRASAHVRVPLLQRVPAVCRFLSCEPLLERLSGLDLKGIRWVIGGGESAGPADRALVVRCRDGESVCGSTHWEGRRKAGLRPVAHPGTGANLDPCRVCGCPGYVPTVEGKAAALALRDICVQAGVAFFWKQWGGPKPTSGGHRIDGREWHEMPYSAAVSK